MEKYEYFHGWSRPCVLIVYSFDLYHDSYHAFESCSKLASYVFPKEKIIKNRHGARIIGTVYWEVFFSATEVCGFTTNGKLRLQRRIDRYGVSKKAIFVIHMLTSLGPIGNDFFIYCSVKRGLYCCAEKA